MNKRVFLYILAMHSPLIGWLVTELWLEGFIYEFLLLGTMPGLVIAWMVMEIDSKEMEIDSKESATSSTPETETTAAPEQ